MDRVVLLAGFGNANRHDNVPSDDLYSPNLQVNDTRAGQSAEAKGIHHGHNHFFPYAQFGGILPSHLQCVGRLAGIV